MGDDPKLLEKFQVNKYDRNYQFWKRVIEYRIIC